ncbi:phosphatidylinositol-binding protein scs2, partial [Coemansia nantahalensis]
PFKTLTNTVLVLTNKNNGPTAFKVKTTAPKQYCVRPNAGRIEPGDSVTIQISLQPMKGELPADFKCRDKFLIQSIQISPEMESMPMTELWAMVERDAKSDDESSAQFVAEETVTAPAPAPAKSQPKLNADQARPQTASDRLFVDSSAPSPADTTALAQQGDSAAASVAGDSPSRAELEAAKSTIQELRRQLAEFKALQDKKPQPAVATRGAVSDSIEGLSMQSVAIVALVAFLVGYFFF